MNSYGLKPGAVFYVVWALAAPGLSAQQVSVWLTTDDQQTLLQPQPGVRFSTGAKAPPLTLYIDDHAVHQTIEGFGASMTDSAAYLLHEVLPAANLAAVMKSLFDPVEGIGIDFLRNPMGASDLARTEYSYDDQPAGVTDPTLAGFSVAHDQADILPLLGMARSINPRLKTMGTPWSPPGWMKTTDSMIGGSLNASAYAPLAGYFVKYLQAYAAAGVPVDYISLQNEPLNVPTDYPGMSMSSTEQLNFLGGYMLPALQAAKLTTRVLVYDHNWDTPSYPEAVLSGSGIANSPLVVGTAWHWYGGPPGAMTTLHNQFPALGNYVTEASGGTWIPDEVKSDFEMIVHSMRNWAKTYVKWGLALDQNRGPNDGGCNTCTPLVTVNSQTGAVSYPIDYYTLGHFSKFVTPGSTQVWSSNAPGLVDTAFVTPDRTLVLVVYNDSTNNLTFDVWWHGRTFGYTLASLAGATFTWYGGGDAIPGRGPKAAVLPTYTIPATRQIQASSYTQISNLQSEPCTDTGGGYDIGYAADGSWLEYDNVDFGSGAGALNIRWASDGSGGTLEFHLDSTSGPTIAQGSFPVTGGWETWQTFPLTVSGAQGVHKLFVIFHGAGASGLGNLNWFQFQ